MFGFITEIMKTLNFIADQTEIKPRDIDKGRSASSQLFVCLYSPRNLSRNAVKMGKSKRVWLVESGAIFFYISLIILLSALEAFAFM